MKSTIINIQLLGYEITVVNNNIKLTFNWKNQPDKNKVISLVERLKADKQEAIRILNTTTEEIIYPLLLVQKSRQQKEHHNFIQQVSLSDITKVDAIREQALSLGWSEARLYQTQGCLRFPCGDYYGLVCFIDERRTIGKVTRQSIEIIGSPPRNIIQRFYNPDVDQPWCKKHKEEH